MYSMITERHWRHSLRVLIVWPDSSCITFQDSTAQNYQKCFWGFISSSCRGVLLWLWMAWAQSVVNASATWPQLFMCADYWCESGWSSWTWLLKTCCTGKVAYRAVCAYPHLHSAVFSFKGHASVGECMQWKKKVLWDELAASRSFCPKYSLPHLIES